ncbi:hypothetical protein [Puniceicoccus vermicola]|uniref:Transposase IS200-like domain-containing protein n=1 Tax=Puniceicoccus vermicola TaxID=388746 RepID=A0A7X1AUJ8_9BACT|nr:hypothetical protein [Puniceicoccus vermicola]MBC2600278.1 hypothetical protein [Puniceicoccus vermicola]
MPHWRQEDSWYFLTYCLADSLPRHVLSSLKSQRERWLKAHPRPWTAEEAAEYGNRFGNRIDELLDAGSGACWLRRSEIQSVIEESLHYFENQRYTLDRWVVMPNHVHVLAKPQGQSEIEKILHT